MDGRVQGHVAEGPVLGTQHFDVGAGLAASGEHQHGLGQHRAPIMQRQSFTGWRDLCRQRVAEPQPDRERSQRVQPDMGSWTIEVSGELLRLYVMT